MSTTSYDASAASAPAACWRSRPIASPNSGPLTARPRSDSQRVSGRRTAPRVRAGPATGRSAPPSRSRSRRPRRAGSAPARPRRRGRATRGGGRRPPRRVHAGRVDVDVGDDRRDEAGDPEPSRARGRTPRGTCPHGAGAQNGSPTRRPASTSSSAAASRTVRASVPAVASPTGSPYLGAAADPSARGLETDEAAARGGDPDRPAAVGARAPPAAARRRPRRRRRRTSRRPSACGSHGVTAGGATSGSV